MDLDISLAKIPSLLRRIGALLYDSVLLLGVLMFAVMLVVIPYTSLTGTSPNEQPLHLALMQIYLAIVICGFYVYFWTHGGQTLGMRAWRFRVIRDDGENLNTGDALKRFGWAALSLLPAGLGLWWSLIDRDGLAWHDRRSHTRPVMLLRPGKTS
ncbi:RDD family protein [Thiocapsa bogorovii]|uniref:RDD family protein n=1 Tax=Thiocapsa bogorovii TaxID=521689 RepID=UPI001E5786C1|nr:RDD family protein [Thiocapsa bogorovii]UHD14982.1 RDD family protein [Thiocapsa bogorovii]